MAGKSKPKHKVEKKTQAAREAALGAKVLLYTLPAIEEGGEDRQYFVFEKLPFNKSLAISRLVQQGITEDQLFWLMIEDFFGTEGVNDLLGCADLTEEDFIEINNKLGEIVSKSYGTAAPKA